MTAPTDLQLRALRYFAEAEPGKGRVIPKQFKRVFSNLVKKKWAWSLGFGGNATMVGILTEAGREAFKEHG